VFADTLGRGLPHQVDMLVKSVQALDVDVPMERLALHLHDAHGKAAENLQRGLDLGIRSFDAATGGCGGCNFVPDAKGTCALA
jgi:hydroxymethylglutaryl-CoA lyase